MGDVTLTTQTQVDDFAGTTAVGGNLLVESALLDPIFNLNALDDLETVGGNFEIRNNNMLGNFSLPSLTTVGLDLVIMNNPAITNLNLANLVSARNIFLTNNQMLTSIDGFNSLPSAESVDITGNPQLDNINGFLALASLSSALRIVTNGITSINGFRMLQTAEDVIVDANPNLESIDGLSRLVSVELLLSVSGNSRLTNIDGLLTLQESIDGANITFHPLLLDLDGFMTLGTADEVKITNNELLANFRGLQPLAAAETTNFSISGNAQNPTEQQIAALDPVDAREFFAKILNRFVLQETATPCAARVIGCETTVERINQLEADGQVAPAQAQLMRRALIDAQLENKNTLPPQSPPLVLQEPAQSALFVQFSSVLPDVTLPCGSPFPTNQPTVDCNCLGSETCPADVFTLTETRKIVSRYACTCDVRLLKRTFTLTDICGSTETQTQKVYFTRCGSCNSGRR